MKIRFLLSLAFVAALGFTAFQFTDSASAGGNNQTGQSIMVNIQTIGTHAVAGMKQYKYNEATAATYFTNLYDGTFTVSCGGNGPGCEAANQPVTPSVPTPDAGEVSAQSANSAVSANQCNFLDGGALIGHPYSQDVTTKGLDNKGNWTFSFNYTVAPTGISYDPFTAWDLESDTTDGSATVSVGGNIAGESVLKSSNAKVGTKFSFSIDATCVDPLTSMPYQCTRVQNVLVTLDGGIPKPTTARLQFNAPGATVGQLGALDFSYTGNAGLFNGQQGILQNGDARGILNGDSFKGNNDGGSGGLALARAVLDNVELSGLTSGLHTVTVSGVVKGNSIDGESTGASISFNHTQTVKIVHPGCGSGQSFGN
jgi:hypothetical protein